MNLNKTNIKPKYQGQAILLFILPIFMVEGLNGYKNIPTAIRNILTFTFERYFIFFVTVMFFYFMYSILSVIFFRKRQIAYVISLMFIMTIAIVHFYKQQFLGTVLQLNDLNMLKSRDQQMGLTEFISGKLDVPFLIGYFIIVLLFVVWGWFVFRNIKSSRDDRIERAALSTLLGIFFVSYAIFPNVRYLINGSGGIKMGENANVNYHNAGIILGLFNNEATFNETMNYDDALELLSKESKPVVQPIVDLENEQVDIVNIMLEGNFPVEEIYSDVQFSTEIQPFFKSLQSKSIYSGRTVADTFGNGTGISEFNYLTGMSNKVFPQPYIAYESHSGNYIPGAASNVKKYNPNVIVNHDFNKAFYNRENVYNNMGFEKFNGISEISEEMKTQPIAPGNYMPDGMFFSYINKQLDMNSDKTNYTFNITMQNHFPYPKAQNEDEDVDILKAPDSYTNAQKDNLKKIATGMKSTDKALEKFISEIEHRKKKTIVVLFGDHQPIINEKFVNEKRADSDYSTHYAVWTNFETKKELKKEQFTISELGIQVQELVGIEKKENVALRGFYEYLKKNHFPYTRLSEYVANDFYRNKEFKKMYTAFFTIHMYNYQGKNFNEGNQVTKDFLENERRKYLEK